MTIRQYHTPKGIIEREPTKEELENEWADRKEEPIFAVMRDTLVELTGKTKEEVEDSMKRNYKG